MLEDYRALVTAMKGLTQASGITSQPDKLLPVGEDEWDTRPDYESYGVIKFDFEADSLDGDNLKQHRSFEGTMNLYSKQRSGDGWPELIEQVLTDHCDCCWQMDYHEYERETALFRWEWVFQVEG